MIAKFLIPFLAAACIGCGFTSVDNTAICQPKKIHHHTPVLCSNYDSVDVSLGVMRNGVGSMSTEDLELAFVSGDKSDQGLIDKAIADGKLVKLTYSTRRFSWCQEKEQVVSVEVVQTTAEQKEAADKRKLEIQQELDRLEKSGQLTVPTSK